MLFPLDLKVPHKDTGISCILVSFELKSIMPAPFFPCIDDLHSSPNCKIVLALDRGWHSSKYLVFVNTMIFVFHTRFKRLYH